MIISFESIPISDKAPSFYLILHQAILSNHFLTLVMLFRKPKSEQPKWSMYPSLHNNVSRHLQWANPPFNFHNIDDDDGYIVKYDSHIMGKFRCYGRTCNSRRWSSAQIAITIRMYNDKRYNARVYHQRCKKCKSPCEPELAENSYVERVVYRLKKWGGLRVRNRPFFRGQGNKRPHWRDLCEGCKAGRCKQLPKKR